MNMLFYKGYAGVFEYIPGDDEFHGRVIGIRDVVHFSGRSVEELKTSMAEGVDDYLAMCEEEGVAPQKPYSGQFRLRMTPEVHRLLAEAARAKGQSLNEFVAEAARRAAEEVVAR